jgi:hypothetical protein
MHGNKVVWIGVGVRLWVVEKRDDEFQNLRQGGMSVAQYVAEFNRLSKYCRRLVNT